MGKILAVRSIYHYVFHIVDITSSNEVKRTSNLETYLHALYKATNYSIRVLAYTSAGEGVSSNPVYCCTEDDRKFYSDKSFKIQTNQEI